MSKSTVYFLHSLDSNKLSSILPDFAQPVALKTHFGEEGNSTYLPPEKVKSISELVENPTLVETSTLYKGPRSIASSYKKLAQDHGFDFAPIDLLDGEYGDETGEVGVEGKHFDTCHLGKNWDKYKSVLVVSHFKGHIIANMGGAIKNLAMGLSGRRGKIAQHANIQHQVVPDKCQSCGICIENCPVEAISYDENHKAVIDPQVCISCSKCMALCPYKAIKAPMAHTSSKALQERIAEYATAGAKDKQAFYINFLINITEGCDCEGREMSKLTPDIGIVASQDPVALDQASYDLVVKNYPDFVNYYGEYQLQHAQDLGLGNRDYNLQELD